MTGASKEELSLLNRFRNGDTKLGFLSLHGLRKQAAFAWGTQLDFCSLLTSTINSQHTGMSALSLQDSDHPPEQNTNLPNGHQDLVASSKGQHPDSTPNLQACTQSEAQAPHNAGQPKVASHFNVPGCSCVTGDIGCHQWEVAFQVLFQYVDS